MLKSLSQFPNLIVSTIRSPWMKGRPDNLDVRSACNIPNVHLGDVKISPPKRKTTCCAFGLVPLRIFKRPNSWHNLEEHIYSLCVSCFGHSPDDLKSCQVWQRPTAREDALGQSVKSAIELLLTHAHGWNRTEGGRREWMGYQWYEQLEATTCACNFSGNIGRRCPILEAHVLNFGNSPK